MDEKLKIKISIADRVYPLTVDVLAMCALQFASQVEQKQIDNAINGDETIDRIQKINAILDENL